MEFQLTVLYNGSQSYLTHQEEPLQQVKGFLNSKPIKTLHPDSHERKCWIGYYSFSCSFPGVYFVYTSIFSFAGFSPLF